VGFSGCGKLIIDGRPYTLERKGSQILVHVKNTPTPFTFVLEAEGKLQGPASAEVAGKVITGYSHEWVQSRGSPGHYETHQESSHQELTPLEAGQYAGDSGLTQNGQTYDMATTTTQSTWVSGSGGGGREVTVPIYAPKTQSCTIGTLAPAGPSETPGMLTQLSGVVGLLSGQSPESANSAAKDLPGPGLRMAGVYTSQGVLKAEFQPASVVLDCGEAHVRDNYTVERTGSQILVKVQNPGSPFTATLQPDGSLSGPASVSVAGRLAAGMSGGQVNFVPRNAQCSVGRPIPNGPATQASAASAPSQSATTGETPAAAASASGPVSPASPSSTARNAALTVASGFPASANPLAGKWVFLMTQRYDDVFRSMGLHPPAGITPRQAWLEMARTCQPPRDCRALYSEVAKYIAGKFHMPASGQGAFPTKVPAGTYYVSCAAPNNNTPMFWDVKVDLKPGENSLTLDTATWSRSDDDRTRLFEPLLGEFSASFNPF
jgi:hypothetical protein